MNMVTKAEITAVMQEFGRRGGKAKSKRKAAAVRENGKLGGRPAGKYPQKKVLDSRLG